MKAIPVSTGDQVVTTLNSLNWKILGFFGFINIIMLFFFVNKTRIGGENVSARFFLELQNKFSRREAYQFSHRH